MIEVSSANGMPFSVFLSLERIKNPALGREGGKHGMPGRVRLRGRTQDLPGKGELRLEGEDRLIFETPGGGGYGNPLDRLPEALGLDLASGLVTQEGAKAYRRAE